MGTRHLVAVQLDGEYRIAQYGQWDGNPGGQGETVLKFLGSELFKDGGRKAFEERLRAARFLTSDELKALTQKVEDEGLMDTWPDRWPELSRDTGAGILALVAKAGPGIRLKNSIGFAGDSLFCEWAYVLDLDKDVLEVYRGYNKQKLGPGDRFASAPVDEGGYEPVRLVASYPLSELPTSAKMVKDCDPPDEG